jgi:hypothetical protein
MLKLVEVVQDFIRQSNIQLNPKKCEMLKIGKAIHPSFPLLDESTGEITQQDCVDDKKVIRHLGDPLGKGKINKMKWCERQLVKMKTKAQILAESGLKTAQVINSMNTFVLPLMKLDQLDRFLRKLINQKIDGLPSPKKYFSLEQRMAASACMHYMIDITYAK